MPLSSTPSTDPVCYCGNVSSSAIDRFLQQHPKATLEDLGTQLGCGVTCGSCVPRLCERLGQSAWYTVDITSTPLTQSSADNLDRVIFSVKLQLHQAQHYPEVKIGQHVVVRLTTASTSIERTYTVVEQDLAAQTLHIAVRLKASGAMTPQLLLGQTEAQTGQQTGHVQVSIPTGSGFDLPSHQPVVFFAAGIGITPAVRLLDVLGEGSPLFLDYSVDTAAEAVFTDTFAQAKTQHKHFDYFVRDRQTKGLIDDAHIKNLVQSKPNATFIICGPAPYVALVHTALQRAKVPGSRIHIEQFFVAQTEASSAGSAASPLANGSSSAVTPPKRTTVRRRGYLWALALLLLSLLLLFPNFESVRPHGNFNVGHADLKCASCHQGAPGTTRQQMQAKVQHWLGLRSEGASFGNLPVDNATCTSCHNNASDRHPAHRFLEPRFASVRSDIAPHMCVSCHREHSGTRLSIHQTNFCASCHSELKVKKETIEPTHAELIKNKRWDTCLQCHDFHGNHRYKVPLRLEDAASLTQIDRYFQTGESPYGEPIIKGKKETK